MSSILKQARLALGLTQVEVARDLGVGSGSLSKWEMNPQSLPLKRRKMLADLLQLDESDIPLRSPLYKTYKPKPNDGVLRRARMTLGLSLQQVATKIGSTKSSISKWEKGVYNPPQGKRIALARFLQIDENDIPARVVRGVIKPSDGVLRRARIMLGLSQQQVATKLGVSQPSIHQWEKRSPHLSEEQRVVLARFLHLDKSDILVCASPGKKTKSSGKSLRRVLPGLGLIQAERDQKLGGEESSTRGWVDELEKIDPKSSKTEPYRLHISETEISTGARSYKMSKPKPGDGVLLRARILLGLTLQEVASELGVVKASVHRWEKESPHPPQEQRASLARLLRIDEEDIPMREQSCRATHPKDGVLRRARITLGLSLRWAATELGVSPSSIAKWEKESPPQKYRGALACLFQVDEGDIPVRIEPQRVLNSKPNDGVLRRARITLGLSQDQAAAKFGVSQSTIANWEKGLHPQEQRTALASLFQIKKDDIPVRAQPQRILKPKPNDGALRRARITLELSQQQIATKLGVSKSSVSNWEKGASYPPLKRRPALARLLGLDESKILVRTRPHRVSKPKPNDGALRRSRIAQGLTQKQVAAKIGVNPTSIRNWEKGAMPQKYRGVLANLLGLEESDILVQNPPHGTNTDAGALKRARVVLGLTQEQVAIELGVTDTSVAQWEKKKSYPLEKRRDALARLLHIKESEIPARSQPHRVSKSKSKSKSKSRSKSRSTDGPLWRARLALNLTQKQVASALGVSKTSVQVWEQELRDVPLRNKKALARLLDINEDDIPVPKKSRKRTDVCKTSSINESNPRYSNRILQRARMALGWGIQQVARKLRVSSSKIERWENESPHPPLKYRAALAQLFDLDEIDILVQEKNTPVARPVQATKPTQRSLPSSFSEGNNAKQNDTADSIQGVLLRARLALGLNRTQVARRVGVSHSSIYAWEMEQRRPSPKYKEALAQVLNLDVDKILATAEDPEERDEKQRLARLLEMKEQSRILAISLQGMPKLTKGYVMLLQARKALRLTIAKVAQVLKVSVTAVWCWENGLEPVPESHRESLVQLLKFSKEEVFLLWG